MSSELKMGNSSEEQWMKGIPTDMLFFFFIKMDLEMIDSLLDDGHEYVGMKKQDFISWLRNAFTAFKKDGDTALPALKGTFTGTDNQARRGYSFMGNQTEKKLDLVIVTNEKMEITNMLQNSNFVFDEFESKWEKPA